MSSGRSRSCVKGREDLGCYWEKHDATAFDLHASDFSPLVSKLDLLMESSRRHQ
jgi:hypothetical protein